MKIKQFVITIMLSFSLFVSSAIGQDSESVPIITAENVEQLAPISTFGSSYLGDLQWSEDGRWLALGTSHDGVQVFQADNLTLAPRIFPAETDVLFHPNSNYLVSGGVVWDIDNQTSLFEFGEVDFQQFSPDGIILFTAQYFNEHIEFTLWQTLTGEILSTFAVDTTQNFKQVVFSDDSSRYALSFRPYDRFSTTGNSFIQVRDTVDASILATFEVEYPELADIIFTNDDQYLVVNNFRLDYGGIISQVIIWDINNQVILQAIDTYGADPLLSPDGQWMFFPRNDQSDAYRIELDTRQIVYLSLGDRVNINALRIPTQYSPDGSYIAIPYYEQIQDTSQQGIILWQLSPVNDFQTDPIRLFLDSSQVAGSIVGMTFSDDGTLIAVSYSSNTFGQIPTTQTVIWDIASQSIRQMIDEGGRNIQFISGSSNYLKIENNLWNIETATLVNPVMPRYVPRNNPESLLVASLNFDRLIVDNLLTREEITLTVLDDYLGELITLDTQDDFAVFRGDNLHIYDIANEQQLFELETIPSRFWVSDNGLQLITQTRSEIVSTGSNILTVYDLETDENTALEDTFTQPETVAMSSNKQLIFASDRTVDYNNQTLYDAQTGIRLAQWQSSTDYVTSATFSPDNQYLLVAGRLRSEDRLEFGVLIWDVSDLIAGETDPPFSILELSQRDFIASADMTFTENSQDLVISLNDALMGDGRINGYRVEIFNWQEILAIEGSLNGYYIEHLTIESAYNPSFHPSDNLILADRSFWNGSFEVFSVALWDSETGELIIELDAFSHSSLSPDGNLVMALSSNPTSATQMMSWRTSDLLNGNTEPLLTLDAEDVIDIGFSADGERILQQTAYSVITLGIVSED